MPDPTIPRVMPLAVERELHMLLHEFRTRPNAANFYNAIRDVLNRGRAVG